MKILRFDSVGGASGDMILAALIGLGADAGKITRQLASMRLGKFRIQKRSFGESGMHGLQVNVLVPHVHHEHRGLAEISKLIKRSKLSSTVKAMSLAVFTRLADAEARVHKVPVSKIHFHEVGAMDSIIDIVGSCIALELLGIAEVQVGPLPMGVGTIESAHGVMPNPAPATVELLKGHPVVRTDEPFELVTPTAAALLTQWNSVFSVQCSVFSRSANAFGHRTLNKRPNLLRATILDCGSDGQSANEHRTLNTDTCLVLETEIDDMNPQLIGALFNKLLESGALDVFTSPVQMKKQRTGTLLTVLCHPEKRNEIIDLIFRESTTFGIREHMTRRTILDRRHIQVKTPYGKVRVKVGTRKGKDITFSPEHDDCVRCAVNHRIPVRKVYEAAILKKTVK
jgi:pyridinium-3,5-bisthiocarboxylic acid mononucleotide nickel chelatase